jgi:tetratricopeptide (TPR) repeat protein
MSTLASPADIRRWTEEVARDPRSGSFLPLARAFAEAGRTAAAIRLCHQGLSENPEHVEAHVLLGSLYRATGDLEKAIDEWDIALRLEPGNADARRELDLARADVAGSIRAGSPSASATSQTPPRVARAAGPPAQPAHPAASAVGDPAVSRAAPLRDPIRRFVARAQPEALLLLGTSGRLLGEHGFAGAYDAVAVASLAAGIHASSAALAELVREPRFAHLYQRGAEAHLFLGSFAVEREEVIVVAITRDEARIGLLRLAFGELAAEVRALGSAALPKAVRDAETFERELEIGRRSVLGGAGLHAAGSVPVSAPVP